MSDTRASQPAFLPKPILEIADVVELFDELAARGHKKMRRPGPPPRTDRWTVRRQLEAMEVPMRQKGKGGKLYFTYKDLAEAIGGGLLQSILDVEHILGEPDGRSRDS